MTTDEAPSPVAPTPTVAPPPAPKRRRRWWNLSVRGLMLLVLVVGGLIGWEAHRVDQLRRAVATLQREIKGLPAEEDQLAAVRIGINGVDESRVRLVFDDEQDLAGLTKLRKPRPLPRWLRWARGVIGEDHFRRVTAVAFDRRPTPEDWDALRALGSVERLSVGTGHATDDDLARLAECAGLRHLSLDGTPITDRTLAVVGTLAGLRSLDIGQTHTSNGGLAHLARLVDLEGLTLRGDIDADAGLAHLRGLHNLRSLTMGRTTDEGLRRIAANRRLESLSFDAWNVTDAGWSVVVGFPDLKELSIHEGFPRLVGFLFGRLETGQAVRITPDALRSLGRLARLEELTLGRFADDAWLDAASQLAQLRELTLFGDAATDAGMAAVGRLPRLERLSLFGSGLTDAGLVPIGRLPSLKDLSVYSDHITDAGAKHLAPAARLRSLTLPGQVTDEAIADLRAAIPSLKYVHISRQTAPAPAPPTAEPAK